MQAGERRRCGGLRDHAPLCVQNSRDAVVLKVAANDVGYHAMLALDDGNRAAPVEIAAMLERLAGYVRRDAR